MHTYTFRKTLITAGFIAAFGAFGAGQAMAHGAAPGASALQTENGDTTMSQKVSDSWITTKVKSEFATTKGVSVTDISVDTKDGVVVLTGNVDTQAEKDMAVKTARSVKGVKAVEAGHLNVGKSDDM